MKKFSFLVLPVFILYNSYSQIGGENTYEFLNLPASARVTALGGSAITIIDGDLSLAYNNPSVLNPDMHHTLTASTIAFMGGINFGNLAYARHWDGIGTFDAGMQYLTYGKMSRTDETANITGNLSAGEYALYIGGARPFEKYSFGGNFKLIYSQLADYKSLGVALDLAATYNDTAKNFTAALVIKNVGIQMKPYTKGNQEGLPFDIQIGISKRLKHLPFRINVLAHNFFRWDVRYDDPNSVQEVDFLGEQVGNEEKKVSVFFDNFFRHFIFAGEFYFGKAVRVGFGYNHLRRKELTLDTKKGLAGVSLGFGIKIKQFEISYGLGKYHLAGTANHFTVNTNIGGFVKKKRL